MRKLGIFHIITMHILFHWIHQIFLSKDKSKPMRRLRWVSQALIISASFNIALLVTFVYRSVTEPLPHPLAAYYYREEQEASFDELKATSKKQEVFLDLKTKKFKELSSLLGKRDVIEDGLSLGDLALAVLVKEHHFDISRSLGRDVLPNLKILIGDEKTGSIEEWFLYPSLTLHEKKEITRFAIVEKWPLTPKGLFIEVQRRMSQGESIGKDIVRSFILTKEFLALEHLMRRQDQKVRKKEVLALALSGDYSTFESVYRQQQLAPNFSSKARFNLLAQYVGLNSKPAVNLLLRENPRELARWGENSFAMQVMEVARVNTKGLRAYCMEILTGPRGLEAWRHASRLLYMQKGKSEPEHFDHVQALQELIPKSFLKDKLEISLAIPTEVVVAKSQKVKDVQKKISRVITYRVVEGDSLWKIAKKFGTDIAGLRAKNQLVGDQLRIGQELVISK